MRHFRSVLLAALVVTPTLLASDAHALERCHARLHRKTGTVYVSARDVVGTMAWGIEAGGEAFPLDDPAGCVDFGTSSRCAVADAREALLSCEIHLADDVANCTASIRRCRPGQSQAVALDDPANQDAAALPSLVTLDPRVVFVGQTLISQFASLGFNHLFAALGLSHGQYDQQFDELGRSMQELHEQIAALQQDLDTRLTDIGSKVDEILQRQVNNGISQKMDSINRLLKDATLAEGFIMEILSKGDITTSEQFEASVRGNDGLMTVLKRLDDDLDPFGAGFWQGLFDDIYTASNVGFQSNDPYTMDLMRTFRPAYSTQIFLVYQSMLAALAQLEDVTTRITANIPTSANFLIDPKTMPNRIKTAGNSLRSSFVKHVGWSIPGALTAGIAGRTPDEATRAGIVLPYLSRPGLGNWFAEGRAGYKTNDDIEGKQCEESLQSCTANSDCASGRCVGILDVPYPVDPSACDVDQFTDECERLRAWSSHMQSLTLFDDWTIGSSWLHAVLQLYGQIPALQKQNLFDILTSCPGGSDAPWRCPLFQVDKTRYPNGAAMNWLLAQDAYVALPTGLAPKPRISAMTMKYDHQTLATTQSIQDVFFQLYTNVPRGTQDSWANLMLACYPGLMTTEIGGPPGPIDVTPTYFARQVQRLSTGFAQVWWVAQYQRTAVPYDVLRLYCEGDWSWFKSGFSFWEPEKKYPSEVGREMNFFRLTWYQTREIVFTDFPITDTTLATGLTPVHTCPAKSEKGEPFVGATYIKTKSYIPPTSFTCNYGGDAASPASKYTFLDLGILDGEEVGDRPRRFGATWPYPYSRGWHPEFKSRGESASVDFNVCNFHPSGEIDYDCQCVSSDPADCRFVDLTNSVDVSKYVSGVKNSPLPRSMVSNAGGQSPPK